GLTPAQEQHAAEVSRAVGEFFEQSRLADAGFALEQHCRAALVFETRDEGQHSRELGFTADEWSLSRLRRNAAAGRLLVACAVTLEALDECAQRGGGRESEFVANSIDELAQRRDGLPRLARGDQRVGRKERGRLIVRRRGRQAIRVVERVGQTAVGEGGFAGG